MRALREMFLATMSRIPMREYDRYPIFPSFNMSIKILIWNVQGVGNKISTIRDLVRVHRPSMLVLVETHISGAQATNVCDRIGFSGKLRVEAQGFAGGIWMFWREEDIGVTAYGSSSQHLTVEIKKTGDDPWLFSAVYASPDSNLKRDLWAELENIRRNYNGPWLLAGDFNDTVCMSERNGVDSSEMQRRCKNFADWIANNNLIDLGFSGPAHTWFRGNSEDTFKSARLDRGLVNEEWRLKFEEGGIRHLPKSCSDHCPILMSSTGFAPVPRAIRPFRFQAAWLNHEKFHDFVQRNWVCSAPIVPFLKEFAKKVQTWNKDEFYNIFRRKSELWARLEGIQKRLAQGGNAHLLKLEEKLRTEMEVTLHDEEMLWFQKSRLDAISEGDRNTRYFHLATIIRRRRNRVEALQDESGCWVTDDVQVKSMVLSYWQRLFQEEQHAPSNGSVLRDYFPDIPASDREKLERSFSSCEVYAALKDMQPFKAPGPDGFQPVFYQRFWSLVQPNVTQLVGDVLSGRSFPDGLNDAFLVLIPKVDSPSKPNQFRPIGLCNIVYKLVTKVIVNRIKPILSSLVAPTQCSFVPKRQITDNVIIVQEMLHSMRHKQGRRGSMMIKIDFEKAYDRLRWSFIRDTLLELRLPQTMVDVVMNCIESAKLSILWNGEPMEYFHPSRGIRQGDPLSPYLYVLCMERLSHLIDREVRLGGWKTIRASRNGPQFSNLAFADDLILFGEASVDQADTMMKCLDAFCEASGSKVSIDKSKVFFSPNTHVDIQEAVCRRLGMEVTTDFGKYLGVPTINGRTSKRDYQYLVEKINDKLAGWKSKTLSLAGRATLIQSSLNSIPYYTMQSTKLPRSTCDEIDRKNKSFLWGALEGERKVHLVAWENVNKSKREGGLGIKSMRQVNAAFLAKLGWRVLAEPTALWSRMLRAKYCDNRCDIDMFREKANSSNAWWGIVQNIDIVRKGINMAVGNGARTFFWHHRWATEKPLIELTIVSPPLRIQDLTVGEMWDSNIGWKFDCFANFLPSNVLQNIAAHSLVKDEDAVDEVYWNGSPSGGFSLTSAMRIAKNGEGSEIPVDSNWKCIWQLPIPQRVRMFLWLCYQDRIMSNSNRFIRRLTDDPRCYSCGEVEENTLHILRDCPAARLVWRNLGVDVDVASWNNSLKEWLAKNFGGGAEMAMEDWGRCFTIACWWLWKWRNERTFNSTPSIPIDQRSFILARVKQVELAMTRVGTPQRVMPAQRVETLVRWIHPGVGWVKLNTDGAAKGNPGAAGGGGLIRGHRGELFEMFAMNCGQCSCTRAELLAVMRGLVVAWDGGHRKVHVELDSEVVVRMLTDEPPGHSPFIHLIRKCIALINRESWEVKVSHCYREANKAADWLANHGVGLNQPFSLIEAVPKDLLAVLLEDTSGVAWPRMVPRSVVES